jgi:Flp pilus assembly protein TadD
MVSLAPDQNKIELDIDSKKTTENSEVRGEHVSDNETLGESAVNEEVGRYRTMVTDILSAKPEVLKPETGPQAIQILTKVVESLNKFAPVSISVGHINDGQKFAVGVIAKKDEKFPVDRLTRWENGEDIKLDTERTEATKETSTLQITLSEDFSFAYLPALISRIENQHAAMVMRNRGESTEVKSLFIDQLKKTTAFYLYFGQKIAEMAQEKSEWNQTMTESLEIYSQVCFTLGTIFAQNSPQLMEPANNNQENPGSWLNVDVGANKWLKEVCWPRTRGMIENNFDRLLKKENFSWEAFFAQFDKEVASMLTDEMNKSFESILFERARKEFLRQSDTLKVLQENAGVFQFEKSIGGPFPKEWRELNTLKAEYKKVKDSDDVDDMSRIEKKVADTLSAVVFCSDFWSLDDEATSLSDTAKNKKINRANQSEILHQAIKHFLGIETWSAITTDQFLSVLPLSDDRLLALDVPPYLLGTAQKKTEPQIVPETGDSWLVLNEHKNLYEANHWNVAGLDFQTDCTWTEAEYCYQKSLTLTPQDPIIHNNLGIVLYKQNKLEEARKHLEKALKVAPDDPMFLNSYGHYLHRAGETQNAFEYFKIASLSAPTEAYLKSDYAHALNALGQKKLALREWEESMHLAPDDLDLVLTYTDALQKNGQHQAAADLINQKITTAKPEDKSELHLEYGLVLESLGETQMARREYENSLNLNPKNVYVWDRLHLLLEKNGSFGETETAYQRAMEIFPDNADLVNNYAFYLKGQNIDDESENNFRKAIKMAPKNAIYRNNYALLLEKIDRPDEAAIQYEHALELNPDDPAFAKNAADFFVQQGDLERAEELFKKAAELVPEKFQYLNGYAIFLEKQNRYDDAQKIYDQWIEKFPNNPDLFNNKAVGLFNAGRYEQAYETGLKTLELQPGNPVYADNVCSFILEGNLNTAFDKFEALQEKYPNNIVFDNCASLVPLYRGEFKDAQNQIHELLKKHPNDAYTFMTAANFYDRGEFTGFLPNLPEKMQKEYYKKFKNPKKALELYSQAIKAGKASQQSVPVNYKEIESRIDVLEKELKG